VTIDTDKQDLSALINDLNGPVHREMILDANQRPQAGEFMLDNGWQIIVDSSKARAPAQHLAEYLLVSFGLRLPVLTSGCSENPAITFSQDAAALPTEQEAYRIESSPAAIKLLAGEPAGFWQATVYLEKGMGFRRSPILPELSLTNRPLLDFRIHRSFFSPYYENELLPEVDPYPDEFLCRLAHYSVNGIWLHGLLRELVPSQTFKEFGRDSERLLGRLNELIERAGSYGIKVYFYMAEPRGFPEGDEFWQRYPHVRGEPSTHAMATPPTQYAMCTSTPEVKQYLQESSRELFQRAPGLGGLILVTASEQHTHCFSHLDRCGSGIDFDGIDVYKEPTCPRCKDRDPVEIVCEVVNCIEDGVHSVAPEAKVIAWNWSWTMLEPEPHRRIIGGLSPNVTLMCGFERGGQVTRFGTTVPVDEYSLGYIGPSPRFLGCMEAAKAKGMDVAAKLQVVATHEMANCGYMPMPYNVCEKYRKLRDLGIKGVMQAWAFGNYPSLPLEVAGWYVWSENTQDIAWLLRGIITRDYGARHVEEVLQVYHIMRKAFDYFPMHQALVGRNPINRAPAYPFYLRPDGRPMALSYLPDRTYGDSLEVWTDGFGEEKTAQCFRALADESAKALPVLDRIEQDRNLPAAGRTDVAVCRAVYHQARSADLLMRFILERNSNLGTDKEGELTEELQNIAREEIAHLRDFLPYVEREHILGFHGEAMEYLYTADMIRRKINDLERMLTQAGKERRNGRDSGK